MRKVLMAVCLVMPLTLQAIAQPKDVEGWGKTKWGMTEEQLLNLFEGQVEHLPRNTICPGGCATLRINDIEIKGFHYQVLLRVNYTTNKLDHVGIEAKEENMAYIAFDSLEQMLMQKYGPPTSQKNNNSGLRLKQRTWIFPSTVITLTFTDLTSLKDKPHTLLKYEPNTKEENL